MNKTFVSLLVISFLSLLFYRLFVHFPVWFDEIFAKALIFGLPVALYGLHAKTDPRLFGFQARKFWLGAFSGLAIGGLFGFVAMFASTLKRGQVLIPYLFSNPQFWNEFGLAFATAWWESLFFYSFILVVLRKKFKNEWMAVLHMSLIFLVFHAPILVLRAGVMNAISPLGLLFLFAFGQGVIFLRTKSIASAIVSHAFWGMALLVYSH